MKKLKAFSLIEILISMALVGILVAILSPNLGKVMPDKKKALFVKAYTRTEIAVANMRNHSEMYVDIFKPADSGESYGSYIRYGLCNTDAPMGYLAGNDSVSGDKKFEYYFSRELGIPNGGLTSNDGITYAIDFKCSNTDVSPSTDAAIIKVSILDKKPGDEKPTPTNISGEGILVKNNGDVSCKASVATDDCVKYMKDRFDLKVKETEEEPAT